MRIEAISYQGFEKLENAWRELECGEDMTAFQMYGWYRQINQLLKKEKCKNLFRELVYIIAIENDKVVMIAPIQVIKAGMYFKKIGIRKGFYLIGRNGYSDYLNFIYKDFNEAAVLAIFKYLQDHYGMRLFHFDCIPCNTRFYKFCTENYECTQAVISCALLRLPGTFDDYQKNLSKNTKQNIRTALNRQKRDELQLTHEVYFEAQSKEIHKVLKNIRAQRLAKKRKDVWKRSTIWGRLYLIGFTALKRFFSAKHDILEKNYLPWYFLVKNASQVVGYYFGIQNPYKKEVYIIWAGVDVKYAWYSPSLSHLYLYIQELYEKKEEIVKVIDFTRGGEKYKKDIGGEERNAYQIVFSIHD